MVRLRSGVVFLQPVFRQIEAQVMRRQCISDEAIDDLKPERRHLEQFLPLSRSFDQTMIVRQSDDVSNMRPGYPEFHHRIDEIGFPDRNFWIERRGRGQISHHIGTVVHLEKWQKSVILLQESPDDRCHDFGGATAVGEMEDGIAPSGDVVGRVGIEKLEDVVIRAELLAIPREEFFRWTQEAEAAVGSGAFEDDVARRNQTAHHIVELTVA